MGTSVPRPRLKFKKSLFSSITLVSRSPGASLTIPLRTPVRRFAWRRRIVSTGLPRRCSTKAEGAGLWFEGRLPRLRLREMLYRRLAQRVYHCPVPIRWNRYTMGMDVGEALERVAEGEYLCLHPHEDGVLGLRPRAEAAQELWGSLGWVARHWLAREPHRCSVRWVDESPQASVQSGKGTWFPELGPARSYRFYQGSLLLVFHSGRSFILPVHHGELLELVPMEDEDFSNLRVGIGIFAPADRLATDLLHSRLLQDEAFLDWKRRLLQRVSAVMRRISSSEEEMQGVKDLKVRVLWGQLCRQLTCAAKEEDSGIEVSEKDCLAGLLGLSSRGVTYHCRELSALRDGARVLSLWIHPERDLSPIWSELEKGQLTLASASNPLYDLVAYCQDLPDQVKAIRLELWSEGCLLSSWSRDEARLLDESNLPRCKNGLMLHIFETGTIGLLTRLRFGQPDPLCQTMDWKDQKQDPALVNHRREGLALRIARSVFSPRPKQATFYQGFAASPGRWGFTLGLSAAVHCNFQGKLHKTGNLRCGMCYTSGSGERDPFSSLQLYRFGRLARTSIVDWGLGAETVRVDASHWDMSRPRKELLAEDGWLTLLEN